MICENCGNEHDGLYGSGRFCSEKCARSFSTKNIVNTNKEAKCIDCNKIVFVNKHISLQNFRCDACKNKYKMLYHKQNNIVDKDINKCKVCGNFYFVSEGCSNMFCKTHSISCFNSLIKFGFDKNKLGTPDVENEFNRIRAIIYDLYWVKKLSATEIAKLYGFETKHCITQTIFNTLHIPKRGFKDASKNAYETGRIQSPEIKNQYKSGYHTTWEGNVVFLRSSYEEDYANELDRKHIRYEVETKHIKYFDTTINEYCTAIPDFYLPEYNTIVEIKSNWTLDVQNMKDKVKEYNNLGYNFKLILEHKEVDLHSLNKTYNLRKNEFSIYRILGSSYGTCWIYNDKESKKIKREHLDEYINNGWKKGRKMKF